MEEEKMMFLRKKFLKYYAQPSIEFPNRFSKREYGFLFFNEQHMIRHVSFARREELLSFLRRNAPAHVYYSSAYYEKPDAPTMPEKKWLGADLIFDLDADHIPGTEKMGYEKMLEVVKNELKKLVSFLIDDFGFEENLSIFFSGGRGYHCHVNHPKILQLKSQERREIVDYITARGLNMSSILKERVVHRDGKNIETSLVMPSIDEPGWRGRMSREMFNFFEKIKKMKKEEAVNYLLSFEGIGEKTAEEAWIDLQDERRMERMKQGLVDLTTPIKKCALRVVEECRVHGLGRPDEPVTGDIRRLIRLPGSLHGKTGFRVTRVKIDGIDEFDPLRDAIVFGDEAVKVKILKPYKVKMKGEFFSLKEGETEVPEYLAVFLIGMKIASV
ncbi:DNA primase [Thermoplasmatales archaeon ex4484_30]|nr:MAG: DNA primase [Thermoplasmatales archaeon ex4484_30]